MAAIPLGWSSEPSASTISRDLRTFWLVDISHAITYEVWKTAKLLPSQQPRLMISFFATSLLKPALSSKNPCCVWVLWSKHLKASWLPHKLISDLMYPKLCVHRDCSTLPYKYPIDKYQQFESRSSNIPNSLYLQGQSHLKHANANPWTSGPHLTLRRSSWLSPEAGFCGDYSRLVPIFGCSVSHTGHQTLHCPEI